MAMVMFYCDRGSTICGEWVLDTEQDLGITTEQWNSMSVDQKEKLAKKWVISGLDFGYREVND
jgi:hypothetical protein